MTGEKKNPHKQSLIFSLISPFCVFNRTYLLSLTLPCFCFHRNPHKLLPSQGLGAKLQLEVDINGSYKSLVNKV